MIKKKNKKELISGLEQTFSIIRRNRDICIYKYDINGLVDEYSVKIGSCYFAFSWISDSDGYQLNKDLTSAINRLKSNE